MSNDYFQYQAAKDQQAELAQAAEQHRLVAEAVRVGRAARQGATARSHHRGARLFGRAPRPTAC